MCVYIYGNKNVANMMKFQQNSAATAFLATQVLQVAAELAGNMGIRRLEGKCRELSVFHQQEQKITPVVDRNVQCLNYNASKFPPTPLRQVTYSDKATAMAENPPLPASNGVMHHSIILNGGGKKHASLPSSMAVPSRLKGL